MWCDWIMRELETKKWPSECTGVAPRLQVPAHLPFHALCAGVTWHRSAAFFCVLHSAGLECAALSPFATNHCASCLSFLQGKGVVEGAILVSAALSSLSLVDFLAQSNFVMHWVCFCSASDSSWQGSGEGTSAEPKGVLSEHRAEIPSLAFLKKNVLKGAGTRTLFVYCSLPAGPFPSSFLDLDFRVQWACQAQAPSLFKQGKEAVLLVQQRWLSVNGITAPSLGESHFKLLPMSCSLMMLPHGPKPSRQTIWCY